METLQAAQAQTKTRRSKRCLVTTIDSGHFKMGNKNVPITNPIRLAGGISGVDGSFHYNSEGGLSASKQLVPGGIIGLTGLDWLVNFLNLEGLKLLRGHRAGG